MTDPVPWLVPPASRRLGPVRRPARQEVQAVVLHSSRTRTTAATLRWLLDPLTRVGGHLVVGPDGDVVQVAPLSARVPHAGAARWRGRVANGCTLGVWVVGPGLLGPRGSALADRWSCRWDGLVVGGETGPRYPALEAEAGALALRPDAPLWWPRLPEAQVATLEWVAEALVGVYPRLAARDHLPGEAARWCSDDDLVDAAQVGLGPSLPTTRLRAAGAGI